MSPLFLFNFNLQVSSFLNSFYPSIEFSVEVDGDKINFLNITVSIEEDDFMILFMMYSENPPPLTLLFMIFFLPHPTKVGRIGTTILLIGWLISPSLSDFEKEISIIKYIANKNKIWIDLDTTIRR